MRVLRFLESGPSVKIKFGFWGFRGVFSSKIRDKKWLLQILSVLDEAFNRQVSSDRIIVKTTLQDYLVRGLCFGLNEGRVYICTTIFFCKSHNQLSHQVTSPTSSGWGQIRTVSEPFRTYC